MATPSGSAGIAQFRRNGVERIDRQVLALIILAALATTSCYRSGELVEPNSNISRIDGKPLSASKMVEFHKFDEGGCGASGTDSLGIRRGFAIGRDKLPFDVPAMKRDPLTGLSDGQVVSLTVPRMHGMPVSFNCWVPKSVTMVSLEAALKNMNGARLATILAELLVSRPLPSTTMDLSREALEFQFEMLSKMPAQKGSSTNCLGITGPPPVTPGSSSKGALANCCASISVPMTIDGQIITATFAFCYTDAGSCTDFQCLIDNGLFAPTPPDVVISDGTTGTITELDSVTFVAHVRSSIPATEIGWGWHPDPGASDLWTQACNTSGVSIEGDTEYPVLITCTIQVHGTGTMQFSAGNLAGVGTFLDPIIARVVPYDAFDLTATDVDADNPNDDLNGPPASIPQFGQSAGAPPPGYSDIGSGQSMTILVQAFGTKQWIYTQAGAQRLYDKNGNRTGLAANEPPLNRDAGVGNWTYPPLLTDSPAHYAGDCTDLVWVAVRRTLGPSWSGYDSLRKADTKAFIKGHSLQWYGYRRLAPDDSAVAGDIVLEQENSDSSGHAGVFIGYGALSAIVAWSNNGSPAFPGYTGQWHQTTNRTAPTKPTTFSDHGFGAPIFFRPIVPASAPPLGRPAVGGHVGPSASNGRAHPPHTRAP
jgi:hypothetical protein